MADERDATAHTPHAHGPQAGSASPRTIAAGAAITWPTCSTRWASRHWPLTPGSSFRGLHDSLVNYRANRGPQPLLFLHEEHAVAAAHGYAKVTGRPMAVGCTAMSG
jgi:hypothetical protein